MCDDVPTINDFKLIDKKIGPKEFKKRITFYYLSSDNKKVDFYSLKEFYSKYLVDNQWKLIYENDFGSKILEFEKDESYITISVSPEIDSGKSYSLDCADYSYSKPNKFQ